MGASQIKQMQGNSELEILVQWVVHRFGFFFFLLTTKAILNIDTIDHFCFLKKSHTFNEKSEAKDQPCGSMGKGA